MKRKIIILIISFFIVIFVGTLSINLYMINSVKNRIVDINEIKNYKDVDAILILGCKVDGDRPSLMLSKRLEKGIEVYNSLKVKLLLSGDHGQIDYDEVNVMRDYLLNSSIPRSDIFLDHAGFSTYDSIYRAKNIFNANKIIIVTQKFHMYRALYLAKRLGIDAVGVVASDIPQKGIMLKNEIREILSRDKNFFKGIFKPKSKYLGDVIPLNQDGIVTEG